MKNAVLEEGQGVEEYVAAVHAELSDLSAEEVEELTDGLRADLADALAAARGIPQTTAQMFGQPKDYAAELRSAAGFAPRSRTRWLNGAFGRPRRAFGGPQGAFGGPHGGSGQGHGGFGGPHGALGGPRRAFGGPHGAFGGPHGGSGQAHGGFGQAHGGFARALVRAFERARQDLRADFSGAMAGQAWWPGVRDFVRAVRPSWWGLRAVLAYWYISQLGSQSNDEPLGKDLGLAYSPLTWLAMLALLVLSVELGRRRLPAVVGAAVVVLNVWLVVLVLLVVPVALYWTP